MARKWGKTSAVVLTLMMLTVLVPMTGSEAAEPIEIFKTDFEGYGVFISAWEPIGWSRGSYASGHEDDLWCRANIDYMGNLSRAVGYTIPAHSYNSTLYGAKLGYNSFNGEKNVDNGYPDPGMDSWVRYAPPNAASYDGMTLTFWYWAKTESPSYQGPLYDYLCVNINNGETTTRAWMQPSPDSDGWRMATVELPAGTIWMEWEFKASVTSSGAYPGALIDDVTVTSGKVIAGPPTSHVGGVASFSGERLVQVPVSVSNADRVSLYYRTGGTDWTLYTDSTAPTGLFTSFTIPFRASVDGRYEVYSVASNDTYTEQKTPNAEASFTVDTVDPTVRVTAPSEGSVFGTGAVTVSWTSGDTGSGIALTSVSVDNAGWTNATGTSYTFRSLLDGSHTVTVKVQDRAGNSAQSSVTFEVDLNAPTMTVSPVGSNVPRNATVVVTFIDDVDHGSVSVSISGVQGELSWSGNAAIFTPSSPLAPNTAYQAMVAGVDAEGDSFSDTWRFTTLEDRGSISGVIRDGNGRGVDNATVTLNNGMKAITDAEGRFEIKEVPAGHYTVSVTKDGYKLMTSEVDVDPAQVSQLGSLSLSSGNGVPALYIGLAVCALVAGLGAVFLLRRKN